MLVVPLGVIGALLAATLRGLNNDVYFRRTLDHDRFVGQECDPDRRVRQDLMEKEGKGIIEATLEASRMRLRLFDDLSGLYSRGHAAGD